MDPVLSGSLCFLVLAIVMYIKFIREHPWADEDDASGMMGDRSKTSPVEPDTMPFLHPTSPVSVLQAQKKMHQQRQQQQQAQRNQGSQPVLRGPFKKVMQATSSLAVGAAGASTSGASTQYLHNKKQPMRRRTHSATLAGVSSGMHGGNGKSASVANSAAGGGGSVDATSNIAMAMDQLPTTIYETRQEHFHRDEKPPPPLQQAPPPSSGRNQHRINFDLSDEDEFDEEMGFLSPRRHSDAANDSLDSVPFEADDANDDGFTDLENHLSEFDRGDSNFHRADGAGMHCQNDRARVGIKAAAPPLVTPSKADTLKTTIDRQFVREAAAPPAQMQLEVARKARIPLFLHSPMYVRTSAAPLVDEVEMLEKGDGDGIAPPVNPDVGRGGGQDAAGAAAGAGQGAGGAGAAAGVGNAGAAYAHARRRGKLPNKMKNQSLHIDFNELQVAEMIGQGAFGTVHRAMWRGTAVAVKILVCQYLTVDILEEFETEVQIMSILRYVLSKQTCLNSCVGVYTSVRDLLTFSVICRHPNICLLMGACLEPPTRCLVIEYLPRGSLWNVLRQDVVIDLNKQLGYALDASECGSLESSRSLTHPGAPWDQVRA